MFDELSAIAAREGAAAVLSQLAEHLARTGQFHELFDARLIEARHAQGLPAVHAGSLDDLPEPVRTRMEDAYLAACREVGDLLLAAGRIREAWMYLRPVGDRERVAAALATIDRDTENYEELIEVALYEGVDPRLGFEYVLKHYGTCNAITLYDGQMHGRSKADRQRVAALLVEHLHQELLRNVRADIAQREGAEPSEDNLAALVEQRPWLFENDNYHVDTTHLAAVVRFALVCDDHDVLRKALDLTAYGRQLSRQYQFPGQEPFADTYPAYALYFEGVLGQNVGQAIAYFRERAERAEESNCAEVLVSLLARAGRIEEAFAASAEFLPPNIRQAGFAPSLFELARQAGCYDRLMQTSRERDDLLGFTMGLIEQTRTK